MNNKDTIEICKHCIVMDLIDIDPDHSQIIYYCELCMITFDCDAYKLQHEKIKK